MQRLARRRPTEIASGLTIAGLLAGFLVGYGVPALVAGGIGAACGCGPLVLSRFVDAWRGSSRSG